jgi:hypothetical protein
MCNEGALSWRPILGPLEGPRHNRRLYTAAADKEEVQTIKRTVMSLLGPALHADALPVTQRHEDKGAGVTEF